MGTAPSTVPTTEVTALVPMRHASQRVPGKNYRDLAGRPLFHWVLETLGRCPSITTIAVDTDSPVIMEGLARHFPDVIRLERPPHLAHGHTSMNDVIRHDLDILQGELFLQTHTTNPLLRPETVEAAIAAFLAARPDRDSLFSVTALHTRLWNHEGHPMNHDPQVLLPTQDLDPVFEENSNIFLFTRQSFLARGNRIGDHPMLFPTDPLESTDIDEEHDFLICQALLKHRRESQ